MNSQLGIVKIDSPAFRFLDASADLALNLGRGERKSLVGAASRYTERGCRALAQIAQDRLRDRVDIEWRPPGLGKIRHAEYA